MPSSYRLGSIPPLGANPRSNIQNRVWYSIFITVNEWLFFFIKWKIVCLSQYQNRVLLEKRRPLLIIYEINLIFFSVERGINQKRAENCINARSALLQTFSVLFSVDSSFKRKNIRFISYHLIFNGSQDSKHSYKPLLNAGLS